MKKDHRDWPYKRGSPFPDSKKGSPGESLQKRITVCQTYLQHIISVYVGPITTLFEFCRINIEAACLYAVYAVHDLSIFNVCEKELEVTSRKALTRWDFRWKTWKTDHAVKSCHTTSLTPILRTFIGKAVADTSFMIRLKWMTDQSACSSLLRYFDHACTCLSLLLQPRDWWEQNPHPRTWSYNRIIARRASYRWYDSS